MLVSLCRFEGDFWYWEFFNPSGTASFTTMAGSWFSSNCSGCLKPWPVPTSDGVEGHSHCSWGTSSRSLPCLSPATFKVCSHGKEAVSQVTWLKVTSMSQVRVYVHRSENTFDHQGGNGHHSETKHCQMLFGNFSYFYFKYLAWPKWPQLDHDIFKSLM